MRIVFDEEKLVIEEKEGFFPPNAIISVENGVVDPFNDIELHYAKGVYEITYTMRNGFISKTYTKILTVKGE